MGEYTGVRCKVIVKEEYRPMIAELMTRYLDWEDFVDEFPFLEEYANLSRASFIPFGSLCYMPSSWETDPDSPSQSTATDGFDSRFYEHTGLWTFQCSLKNYQDEIEIFFDQVLSKIAASVIHLEKYYEHWKFSKQYDLVEGKITLVNDEFIQYEEYDSYSNDWYGYGGGE